MLEIGISSIATVFSVFVIYLHSNWMNDTAVPQWLLQLTCLAKKKHKPLKISDNSSSDIIQV
jgi:hypothetical protein